MLSRGKLMYIGCSLAILLIIPSIFYNIALKVTILLTFIPAALIFWIVRKDQNSIQVFLVTLLITIVSFIAIILAEVSRLLYWLLVFSFVILQDLSFKFVHYCLNKPEWFIPFQSGTSIKNNILYCIPILILIFGAYHSFPSNAYQNIREMPFSFNLMDAFSGGKPIEYLINFANETYSVGVNNIKSLLENLAKPLQWLILSSALTTLYKAFDPIKWIRQYLQLSI
ncbi:hypothetical protein [Psychrobacter sp.]|uniref:hypothetical protein n=1 Tax=Psychrobacter sp. TaxID=56811 RepID=UPI0035657209